MTREEAIHFAECLKHNWTIDFNDMEEFCDMAIEALSEPVNENREIIKDILQMMPTAYLLEALGVATFDELMDSERTGEWIRKNYHTYICNQCGYEESIYGNVDDYRFCSHCGARMVKKDGEK